MFIPLEIALVIMEGEMSELALRDQRKCPLWEAFEARFIRPARQMKAAGKRLKNEPHEQHLIYIYILDLISLYRIDVYRRL